MPRKQQFEVDGVRHATINGHRFHLRWTDPGKDNFLWIDGKQPPLILDQTAADFVAHLIDAMWLFQTGAGDNSAQVIRHVVDKMYDCYGRSSIIRKKRVTRARIEADFQRIFGMLMAVADSGCPYESGLDSKEINYGVWAAPARMDLAVTYRCNLQCSKCYLGERSSPDMPFESWLEVYKRLWEIGISQVVFTGGEPLLRPDIVQLVSEADEFVTGLITNGTELARLAQPLRDASLDYVQVTIESAFPTVHDLMTQTPGSLMKTMAGIRAAVECGLQVVTNTTLTKENADGFCRLLRQLEGLGVKNVACNTLICSGRGTYHRMQNGLSDAELLAVIKPALAVARDLGQNLQWYSPTCYNQGVNPIELGFGVKACSAAAHNMMVGPDGEVFPCQSWPKSVGNILLNSWPAIWEHPTCVALRNHEMAPAACRDCEHLSVCGGGCPLDKDARLGEVKS